MIYFNITSLLILMLVINFNFLINIKLIHVILNDSKYKFIVIQGKQNILF